MLIQFQDVLESFVVVTSFTVSHSETSRFKHKKLTDNRWFRHCTDLFTSVVGDYFMVLGFKCAVKFSFRNVAQVKMNTHVRRNSRLVLFE